MQESFVNSLQSVKITHRVRDDKEKGTESFIEMYALWYSFGKR